MRVQGRGTRPRRILFVVNVSWFFVSHRLPLAVAAIKRGDEVHLAAAPEGDLDVIAAAGIHYHPFRMERSRIALFGELTLLWRLMSTYRKLVPDLVHHVTIKPVIYGSVAARFAGIPRVVNAISGLGSVFSSAQGIRGRLRRQLVFWAYRLCLPRDGTRVIFQNEEDRQLFVRNRLVKAADAVLIRGAGVDLRRFPYSVPPRGIPLVVLAGRMLRSKGVPEFVQAARELLQRGQEARFALVGPLDEHNPDHLTAAELADWQRQGLIDWLGQRTDMPEVLAQSTIVCLPTRYGEGVPKVLIEAAAIGRPIVTTDVPGCRDIVQDGVNGCLVPPGDVEALTAALAALLGDRDRCVEFGRRGRERAELHFGVDRVVSETLAVYDSLFEAQ